MTLPSPLPETSDWITSARPILNGIRSYLANKYNPLPPGSVIQVVYSGSGPWGSRPTSRTDLVVWWVGGPESTKPAGALANDLHLPNAD